MSDPFSGGFPGGFDPSMFGNVPLFREMAKVMSWSGGPVNWDLAAQSASSLVERIPAGGGTGATGEFEQAVGVAELWLDQVTDLPRADGETVALSVREWTTRAATSEGLGRYLEPIAEASTSGMALPEELQGLLGAFGMPEGGQPGMAGGVNPLGQVLKAINAMMFGMQAGTVTGHLAAQLLSTYDLGVPTVDPRVVGTVGDGPARFAAEHALEPTEFNYWLALRETAHRRQFAGVPWLGEHLAALLRRFAEGAEHDPAAFMESLGGMGLDLSSLQDPDALARALEHPDAFRIEPTPDQRVTLSALQALVTFTTAWVDVVIRAAAGDKLPSLARIEEAMGRRRAEKGPGERFLQQLVGLDLQPSDTRQGQAFCAAVLAARGQAGLDRVWRGPELLPTAEELAEPSRWLLRLAAHEQSAIDEGSAPGPDAPGDLAALADLDFDVPDDLAGLDQLDGPPEPGDDDGDAGSAGGSS